MYQRIGFQCLSETLFEDAGKNLFKGELDPRLLISYYPTLRGSLFTSEDSIDVFTGVANRMPRERSVEEISKSSVFHTTCLPFAIAFRLLSLINCRISSPLPFRFFLELISCGKLSQELFSPSCAEYEVCTTYC